MGAKRGGGAPRGSVGRHVAPFGFDAAAAKRGAAFAKAFCPPRPKLPPPPPAPPVPKAFGHGKGRGDKWRARGDTWRAFGRGRGRNAWKARAAPAAPVAAADEAAAGELAAADNAPPPIVIDDDAAAPAEPEPAADAAAGGGMALPAARALPPPPAPPALAIAAYVPRGPRGLWPFVPEIFAPPIPMPDRADRDLAPRAADDGHGAA